MSLADPVGAEEPSAFGTEVGAQEASGFWSLNKTIADQRGRRIRFLWWANARGGS